MNLLERRATLEALLLKSRPLWAPSPFREQRPDWCSTHPDLSNALLALDDEPLARLSENDESARQWLLPYLPVLEDLPALTELPGSWATGQRTVAPLQHPADKSALRDIPGRKLGQIEAFVNAVGKPQAPLVEWCAGKGHLSRHFLLTWGGEALAVERNPDLCAKGEALAQRIRPVQRFQVGDVMEEATRPTLREAHAIALHACGDLHVRLVRSAQAESARAIDIAPCCYQLTKHETYPPFLESGLALDRDHLKLAVTETVTASPRQIADSQQASAWKLGFIALRDRHQHANRYRPFKPVPWDWQTRGFQHFITKLAEREQFALPSALDWAACEAEGWQRHHESRRLQLVRMAFRRAIEVWLLSDMGVWLERQDYKVTLREFCARHLTPRNLLLSARRN